MISLLNQLNEFIDSKETEMLELLKNIVNMDSGSKDKREVDLLGKCLQEKWRKTGFEIEELQYSKVGNCYIARFNKDHPGKKVVLIGHLDTVFPKGETNLRPFKIEGNMAFGPGVGDMKGGLVTMLYAVKALKCQGYLTGPLSVILNSHEEIGSTYIRDSLVNESKDARIVFNLEPARPDGAVVTERKGVASLDIRIHGKAVHAGVEPQKGANANLELAYRIIELQNLNHFREGLTVNANVVSGGFARNVISDIAKAEVDIRFKKKEDIDLLNQHLLNSLSKPKVSGTKCHSKIKVSFLPMERNANILSAYHVVQKAGEELGITINEAFSGGGADSGLTAQNGVPTICGMGPIAGNAHSNEEYLKIPTLTERCKLLALAIALSWKEAAISNRV